MMKKVFSLILTLTLLFCTGCSPSEPAPVSSETDLDPVITSSGEDEEDAATITYYPSQMEGEGTVLTWALLNYERVQLSEDVIIAFNEALEKTGCGYQVQFAVVTGSNPAVLQAYQKEFAKKADLITCYGVTDDLIEEGAFLPLNDWIDGEGSFLNDVLVWEKDWLRSSRDGVIYGIPTMTMYANAPAWDVNKKVIEDYGISPSDLNKEFWELSDALEIIYQKEGQKTFLAYNPSLLSLSTSEEKRVYFPGTLSYLPYYYELLTSTVGIDWRQKGSPIVSIYESEFMEKTIAAWQEYYQKGYLFDRSRNANKVSLINPSISYSTLSIQLKDTESYILPIGNTYLSSQNIPSSFLAVSSQAPHQDKAFDFIKRVFSDQELYNLLVFGLEGENYTLEDGTLTQNTEKPYSGEYLLYGHEFSSLGLWENHFLSPARDGLSVKEAHRQDLEEAIFTPYAGIVWDFSKVENERQATEELLEQYATSFGRSLKQGTALNQLETFQTELKEAGIDTLLAELNRQAQEWKEAHPS